MGVETTRGEHGKPIANSTMRTTADFQAGYDYTAAVGNRVIVNTYEEMTTGFVAKFGFQPWDGLECFNTDSGDTTIYRAATQSWEDPDLVSIDDTNVFTTSSGWAIGTGSQSLIQLGAHLVQAYVSFQRTGGALNPGANGNLDNVTVGRWVVKPVGKPQPLQSGYAGRLTSYMVDTTGLMQLTAATPGNTIGTGDYISAAGLLII